MTAILLPIGAMALIAFIALWVRREREDAYWVGYWKGRYDAANALVDADAAAQAVADADAATGTPVYASVIRQMDVRP